MNIRDEFIASILVLILFISVIFSVIFLMSIDEDRNINGDMSEKSTLEQH